MSWSVVLLPSADVPLPLPRDLTSVTSSRFGALSPLFGSGVCRFLLHSDLFISSATYYPADY